MSLRLNNIDPLELELCFISSHLSPEKIIEALSVGIKDDSFQIDEHAKIWNYLTERFKQNEKTSIEDIKSIFDVELMVGLEDSSVWLNELITRTLSRRARITLISHSDLIDKDPAKAIHNIVTDLNDLHHPSSTRQSYFDGDALSRYDLYLEKLNKINSGEVIGIPTGLPCFDLTGDTWKPGEVIAVQGPLNIGKSWLLIYFAAYAYYYSNCKVLFLSPENTISDINARLDPVIGRFMGYKLSNRGIRNGAQDPSEYSSYLKKLAAFDRKDFIVRDSGDKGAFNIDEILAVIREYKPQLTIIDGFHLINNGGKTWENMKESAEQIKGLAQYQGMTVIAGSQVTRSAVLASDETPELGQSAYGMGLVEAANRVIVMAEKRDDKKQRIFKVPKYRDGEQILQRKLLNFDVDSGDIHEITIEVDHETGSIAW